MLWLPLLAVPVAGLLGFVAVSHARWRSYQHTEAAAPDGLLRVAQHAAREALAVARVGGWHLEAFGFDRTRVPALATGRPVLCVHGLSQNGTNLWGIRRALEGLGRPTRAVSLGRFGRRLEAYVPALVAALRELDGPDGVDVVAHSMGGVVLRMALASDASLAARVRTVVTLGTPHHGTAALRGLPGWLEAADLRRDSALLARLPHLGAIAPHARIFTVAGAQDAVVYPIAACHAPGSTAIDLPDVGHAGLLVAEAAIARVIAAIAA